MVITKTKVKKLKTLEINTVNNQNITLSYLQHTNNSPLLKIFLNNTSSTTTRFIVISCFLYYISLRMLSSVN